MKFDNPKVPSRVPIEGGLRPGMTVYFKGTVHPHVNRFAFNLLCAHSIAMHFNPRFRGWSGVVFNTRRGRRWNREERTRQPFQKGAGFEVLYTVTPEGYQVDVNGALLHLFRHRMPAEQVIGLNFTGNVSLETVIIGEGKLEKTLSIPLLYSIDGGLKTGMSVFIKGMVHYDINRFHVNLQHGDQKRCDKALHFNPRFKHQEVVVFNTFRNGRWENEERPGGMPFTKGEVFELVFFITSEGYQVKVNGNEFYLFKHRMPVEYASAIKIAGDVSIQTVDITQTQEVDIQICPIEFEGPAICALGPAIMAPPILEPPVLPVKKIDQNVDPIYCGLRAGMSVYFKGTVPKDCRRFSINLHCQEHGDQKSCDNAFHFNPRFDTNMVVFNTFRNGRWENEERPSGMPFSRGEDFRLVYIITSEGYQVNVNDNPFHMFKHRMPLEHVTAMKIFADVAIEAINIVEEGDRGMQGLLHLGKILPPSIPYVKRIYGGLKVGMRLYFRGVVHRKINRFHINLQYGQKRGLKALHFNPRFSPSQVVVLNSFRNGRWDLEERVHEMPFCKGGSFEILFIVTAKGYQVNVNGRQFYTFKHRMPVKTVNAIKIAGDVSIESINITGGGQDGVQGYRGLRMMTVTKIPHVGLIYGGLRTGTYMYFRGTIPHNIARFHINLNLGEMKGCDKALHFNPRFKPSEVVVFNTFRNGRWDREERVNKMPFRRGEDFELLFIVNAHGFQVNINGRQFYLFKHRMPVEHVSALKIAGDVSMKTVHMIRGVQGALAGHPSLGKMVITKIPHVGPVYGGLRTGMALFFRGTVPQEINRFHINLQSGELKGSDKALHFNPRFAGGEVVVFNTMRNGRWENEERPSEMPFRKGEDFELVIIITAEGYQVNVNGRQFYLFKHRMPVEQVSAIKIAGDVSMQTLNMTEAGKVGMLKHPGLGKMVVSSIPFVGTIHGCLRTGMYMYFRGTVHQNINRFHINLQYGEKKGCDKALHFNPRFAGNGVIVFNSFQNGWKREERVHQMPFCKGEDFELVFIVTSVGYQVIVNGRPLYLFKHRMPVDHVSALKIAGDVSMEYVNLIGGGNRLAGLGKMAVTSIPHLGPILGGLRTGMFMFFRGTVSQGISRFHINLQLAEKKGCDKALHFNPRFQPHKVVVFNTFRNGRWEREERVHEMPFTEGEEFELLFIVTPAGYQVIVNGRQYYLFKHRMPLEHVSALKIAGDVSMEIVKLIGGEDDDQEGRPGFGRMVIPKIAHVGPIRRGLKHGMALQFQGTVLKDISRFHINLQYGRKDGCDLALHFNPRFKPYEVVVFNTFRKGRWEREERPKGMPFSKGEDFELVFYITSVGFQVYVNGAKFYLFKHRMPVENVNALKIAGDISMEAVDINEEEPEEKPDGEFICGGILERPDLKEILSVPYLEPISGGLRTGASVLVKGTVPSNSYRFSINLYCGEKDGSDDALHFNPRFDSNLVVFNTFRNGHWENEERPSGMPFSKGEEFETVITATSDGYQVNVNGSEFHLFKHRMPLANVSVIKIVGDVSLHEVTIIGGGSGEIVICPGIPLVPPICELRPPIIAVPEVLPVKKVISYVGPIYGGLRPGMSVLFRGTVPQKINRFSINLHCEEKEGCDNAFHFNPRFHSNVVVFNTFRNGGWENEERPTEFPFHWGEDFEVLYIITSEGYQVKVNGKEFHLYKHRMPVEQVSAIKIFGDVSMHTVYIIQGGQKGIPKQLSLGKMTFNTVPYHGPIHGGVRKGMYLYFRGTVHDDINRFHINLECGGKKGNRALHFNPRFKPSEVVVFNTFLNGRWGKEERVHEMPFHKGESFELVFFVTPKGYQVIVNGRRFYMYKHRLPVEHVNTLAIAGDVSMETLKMIGGGIQKYQGPRKILVTKIPHVGPVYGSLRTGMYVFFRGTVPQNINRFHINLQYGKRKGSDIALHFNPRFTPSEVVVFNSFRNGRWENEERPSEMPFRKGEDFELVFFITAEGYQVNVNGRRFHFFKHRMPVETVGALSIAGDVSIKTANMIGGGREGGQLHPSLGKIVVSNIPHVGPVYGGLRSGLYLYFKGTIPQEIKRFHINLQYGQMKGCDKALHFNPRFEPEEVVVFNSFRNGSWEQEERPAEMPFSKGEDFELVFIITSEGYQVNVNGRQFYLFKHRMPVEQVNAMKIAGEVSMETVNLTEGGQEDEQPEQEDTVTNGFKTLVFVRCKKIPHLRSVHGGLRSGTYLYFKGTIPQEIKRFHINLQYGEKKGCDKALHFNPRFEPEEVVVFNTFRNGSWENEERPTEMPFRKGEDFELFIFVTAEGYQVNVNGRQYYLFKHRMPVEHVSAVKVVGDVSMKAANVIKRGPGAVQGKPDLGTMVVSKIPHVGSLFGGLRPGMYLYFRGTVPQEIERFHINLQYGKMKGCDKALHFNPRFKPEEVVVFNSFRNGGWENEERPSEMPFRKGEDFELVFFITSEGYQVYVNGRHFHLFKHRMPVEQVSAIKIVGDVSVQKLNTIKRVPGHRQPGFGQMAISKIPHVGRLFGGLRPGMSLYFRGTVPKNINRFHINLQSGDQKGCDKALHFNPRFKPHKVVVFNTFQNGKWEKEERPAEMPFREGEQFVLVFIVTSEGYQVNVNGREFYLFKHRIPLEQVSAIKIAGEVSIETGEITQGEEEEPEKEKEEKIVPSIPHVGPISGGLRPGMSLCFSGTIPEEANRFSINLHCGDEEGCDNAFHFNPRFEPSDVVVFNTFRNGSWENEERVEDMPFQPGDNFELVFVVTSEGYKVKVNDRKFYLFKHRMPMENVTTIRIFGDVSIQTINIIEGGTGAMQGRLTQGKIVVDKMPFVEHLHHSLKTGMYMYFRGKVDDDINRFHINLQDGDMKGCAKALHFNPRFQPHEVVVFNTFQNGKWGNEERVNEMPFRKGEEFELVFIVTAKGYQVIVNGRRFYMFKHRLPVNQVSALKIAGDVSMETIDMTEICLQGYQGRYKMAVTKIPHVSPVLGGLRPGMYLYFRGTVPEEINRFHINLQYGQGKGCDKALHFNPRFTPEEVVVLNSFRNGGWQHEERPSEMPFRKGEEFELLFIITSEGYQVNVNGRPFYLYKHRMLVENVAAIKIVGDISIKTANMIGGGDGGVHPSLGKMVVESIPHVGPVYGGLWPGMFVVFRGTVPQEIKRFHINLQYGQIKGCDKALHFNPRFEPEEVVVFNSFRNGSWENEERPSEMPFRKGEDFEIVFVITSEGYQVYVNGRYFCLFKHRMPVEHVSAIKIAGDVSMKIVDMTEQGKGAPELPPPVPVVVSTTPQLEPITGGLRPGMYLYFKGTVPQEVKRFAINLQNGQIKGCDKALHFNPRFDTEEVVVFNSFKNGSWENEERPSEMPFRKGEDFEMVIIVTTEGYQVNVNGRQFHFFKHRIPLEQVSAIKIAGDVAVQSINTIQGGPKQPGLGKIVISEIPHLAPVYGGLRPGMYLYFKGTIPQDIKRFHINLNYGDMKGCDKALHFNPRFEPEEVVVFNSFKNGSWENEERPSEMPFRKGEDFELIFFITREGYQVNVNGRQFHFFKHRMPVDQVSGIKIVGDVTMRTLNMIEGGQPVDATPGQGTIAINKIPHVGPVYGGLRPGMSLFFLGTVPEDIKRFAINLQYGTMTDSDIAFHFNPRFEPEEVVVFNSFKNGSWEKEERVNRMPFQPGSQFGLVFIVTKKGYKVLINGDRFYVFKHRMPVQQVSALKITGTIFIMAARMIEVEDVDEAEEEEPKSIPHVGPISGGLRPGMSLCFSGTIPKEANRFSINLHCGDEEGCDNAFHFNPRFEPSGVVVFNTFRNGSWENEERVEDMPFQPGDNFKLVFVVTSEGYKVKVNDRKFYLFKHRMPMENVTTIRIFGDVSIQTINIIEGGTGAMQGRLTQGKIVVDKMPFVEHLHHSLKTGMYMYFRGKVDDDIKRFHINLQNGDMKGCAKALHFNPRFQPHEVVVFNTFQNGKWGKEERVKEMPFRKGEEFELVFIVTAKGYQVIVNGRGFYMFKHRLPVNQVSALKIAGDVSMETIDMTEICLQGYQGRYKMAVTKIPHVSPVLGGLRPGMYLYFRGTVPEEINRFHINLQYGQGKGCDKALHFNPRFTPEEVVVLNSFQNGGWQQEERPSEMPFRKGEEFELLFIITSEGYQVNVNGRPFYLYKHRMLVENVAAIKIVGDISIKTANMIGGGEGGVHPSLGKMVVESIPHVGPVYGGLWPGMFVVFRGTVPQEIKRFHINLQYGQIKGCDKALHFNPRFEPEEVVVFNSFRNGSWENEERPTEMPFRKGEDFEIVFVITSEGYQVYVNGRYFCLFKHRMPVEHVSAIKIAGDVSMKIVDMTEQGKGAPELPPPVPVVVSTTPQLEPITGGLRPGMYLYFKGTVPQEVKRFAINLQNGQIKGCDKALHFNPRFDTEEVVVFNSFKNGSWEDEERPSEMPFRKGEDFEMVIIVTTEGYQVNVNGRQFHFFKHRIPLEQVSAIKIAGDVAVQSINTIQGGPKQPGLGKIVISEIPHLAPVYGGLRPGMYLYFKGTIPQDIKRFHINLNYGDTKGCDKALHFNPRFEPEEVVVFNSFKNGSWENEERPSEMPFRKGEDFELIFFITRKGYQVNVNGRQFHFFKHRMPVDQVSGIKIVGDVTMRTLNMIEGGQPVDATPGQGTIAINKIPHVGPVYGGLRPGMSLFFLGTVPEDIKRFAINLQYGTMTDSDIAFHFNPRFEPEEVVVFNSFKNGSWEEEERVNRMPFQPGSQFGLVFIVTKEGYKVLINGDRFYVFKHRMPVQQVSALKITGTIFIMAARMIEVEDVDEAEEEEPKEEEVEEKEKPAEEEEPKEEEVEEKEKPAEEEEPKEEEVEEKEKPAEEEKPKEEEVEEKEKPAEEEKPKEEKPAEKEEEPEEEEVLSGDVKPGMAVYFKGTVPNEITRFAVDLRCGDAKDSDVAFRFESRFEPSEVLVFNSFKNGSWEEEERVNEMPFRRGESFELVFHVLEEGYQVYVERRQIYLFKHRIPVEQVTSVQVIGEISMQTSNLLNIGQFTMTQEPDDDVDETTQLVMSIPGSLKSGLSMSFQGMIPDESTRFTIDLQCGDTEGCDTAFRFNPRLETSEVVFNSFKNGSWEEEEKVTEMPFTKGESFLLVFMLKSDGYQVNVNGRPLYMFKHRMVLEQVRGIRIFGGVSIQNVNIVEIVQEVIEIPEEETEAIQAEAPIPDSLKTGTTLTLLGTIPEETKSFSINLQCGEAAGCDTAFHFNPKFETSEVEFNTFRNGSWEEAEKVDNMPFTKGKEFKLTYIITSEGYQVNVNDAEFYLFKHRISVEQVKVLQIAGDVSVTAINVIEGTVQEYPSPAAMGTVQTNIPVPGCLKTWMTVSIQGLVPAETDSFSINLQCGDTQGCDTAFHFSSQFKTSELVFNSFRNGHWEEEERVAQMPFKTGENFTLDYTITLEGYEVNVNGHFIHTFMHRMPVAQVSLMQIIGDVSIITINIIETSPSVTPLPSGLKPGTSVIFQGALPSESNRFSIDLQCGETEGCDTAFQFQPQLEPEEVVVCNSFQNGSWETEERLTEMPFRRGEDFELVYNITAEGYQVKVNGQQFHMFKHRIPVEQVRALLVAGNVNVPAVHIIEGGPFVMEETAFETVVTCAPYVMPIPGGFKEASSVNFRGSIPEGIPSFSIDLQCGEAEGSDTALRFNPQFEPAEAVVFNSFRGGSWETEERVDAMPFRRGESFEVTFHITAEGYQVKVNGAELHMFKHRIPVEQVSALQIVGNVTVETVNIIEGDFGAVPPSCFGQMEVTGSIGGETWTCGVAEVERGDGPI